MSYQRGGSWESFGWESLGCEPSSSLSRASSPNEVLDGLNEDGMGRNVVLTRKGAGNVGLGDVSEGHEA